MFLVRENRLKNRIKINLRRIYINTLVPYFHYKNREGDIVKPKNICINL